MTVRQKVEAQLFQMGIFENTAAQIMDYAIPLIDAQMKEQKTSLIAWDSDAENYPQVMYAALFVTHINRHVLALAENNMPMAWWKPMFMTEKERQEFLASSKID